MAVISNAFPWGLYYGCAVSPGGLWAIIDEPDRTKLHITADPTAPSVAYTFGGQIAEVLCDGARWYAKVLVGSDYFLYRSTDGLVGAAWASATSTVYWKHRAVSDGVLLRAGVATSNLIERSTDSGATWASVLTAAAVNGGTIYAVDLSVDGSAAVATTDSNVVVSSDGGVTWSVFGPPLTTPGAYYEGWIATFAGATGGVVYAEWEHQLEATPGNYVETFEVYRSTDFGQTWVDVTASLPSSFGHSALRAYGGSLFCVAVQDGSGALIECRRVTGSGTPQVVATVEGLNAWPNTNQVGVSQTQFALGSPNSAAATYLFDLPLAAETIELLSLAGLSELFGTDVSVSMAVSGTAAASSAVSPFIQALAAFDSTGAASSTMTYSAAAVASLLSAASFVGVIGTVEKSAIVLASTAVSDTGIPLEAGTAGRDVWVMNLETGGFTRYEGFDFTSFAKVGDTYYGCKPDGIYALDGDTDAGEPIRSMVSFGKQNFGTSALKRVTNAYVGVSGAGRLFLKVLAEGQEYTYAQRSYDEHIQTQRFDTGKGLRVNWLEFELYNADGEDFELASVEFAAVPLSRRI